MAEDNTQNIDPNKIGDNRQPDGTFGPGNVANPEGRPKGAGISIITEIKRRLNEVPEGQKATYLELLINRILKQAIQDGDTQMIKLLWAYIDGMPIQPNAEIPPDKIDDYLHIYKPEKNEK